MARRSRQKGFEDSTASESCVSIGPLVIAGMGFRNRSRNTSLSLSYRFIVASLAHLRLRLTLEAEISFLSHLISFVRIPALAIRQHVRRLPALHLLGEDCLRMRVWPHDIDLNLHMNNARYLSVMDYARTHLLARTRLLEHLLRARWTPLLGAVWMTYRRSLPLFAQFTVTSRLVCWDEKWFYMEHTFNGREGLSAVGWVKAVLRDPNGNLEPQKVLEAIEPGIVSPPIPETIAVWNELTREKLEAGLGV